VSKTPFSMRFQSARLAFFSIVLAALLAAALVGCGGREPAARPARVVPVEAASSPAAQALRAGAEGANLIIILIDAARADHFSGFGYEWETTSCIDALFDESIVFEEAYATAPNTKASTASLFTSQHPDTHGAVGVFSGLPTECTNLAEAMKSRGYVTGAFSANPFLAECFGFARGFDEFFEVFREVDLVPNQEGRVPAERMVAAGVPWLREHADEQFFVYFHFLEPHAPYDPPPPFRFQFIRPPDYMMGLYDGNLGYVDDQVGELLEEIDRLGLTDHSVIVFLSDHGEAFGEHGRFGHTTTVYQEMIYVPLSFRFPPGCEASPQRRSEIISLADVMPTLLDLYGLDLPDTMQGKSRLGLLTGEPEGEPCYAVSRSRGDDATGGVQQPEQVSYALTGPRYTLLLGDEGRRVELYDREVDPGLQEDIAGENGDVVDELRQRFEGWADTQAGRPVVLPGGHVYAAEERTASPDEQTRRQLRALGYLD